MTNIEPESKPYPFNLDEKTMISVIQNHACTEDYCFICSRATDHWGEHDDVQIVNWANSPQGQWLMRTKEN